MALGGSSTSTGHRNTSVRLLQAACDLLGGEEHLADRLKMSRLLLRRYLSGRDELPSHLLLRIVDIVLEERESALAPTGQAAPSASGRPDGNDLPA